MDTANELFENLYYIMQDDLLDLSKSELDDFYHSRYNSEYKGTLMISNESQSATTIAEPKYSPLQLTNCEDTSSTKSSESSLEITTIKPPSQELSISSNSKRSKSFHNNVDISELLKGTKEFIRFYKPLKADYRHIYSALICDSVNSSNFGFLYQILENVVSENCVYLSADVVNECCGNVCTVMANNRADMFKMITKYSSIIPDIMVFPHKYNMYKLAHIPLTFANVPLKYFNNIDYLNAHVLHMSKEQCILPSPGYIILGKCVVKGTPLESLEPHRHTSSPVSNNSRSCDSTDNESDFDPCSIDPLLVQELYIYVLDDMSRVARMEHYFIKLDTAKAGNLIKYEF